jgi:hypothetical protein
MKRFKYRVGINGHYAEALQRFAPRLILPEIPYAAEGKQPVIGESNSPRYADLLLLVFRGGRFPFIKEFAMDEAAPSLPRLPPSSAALEIVIPCIDGTESGLVCLLPVGDKSPLHHTELPLACLVTQSDYRLETVWGDVVIRGEGIGVFQTGIFPVTHTVVLRDVLLVTASSVTTTHESQDNRLP